MSVRIIQFSAAPADVADVESALEQMCAAVHEQRPVGARFAVCKLDDGVTFLNILQLADGVPNPLPGIEACRAFQQQMRSGTRGDQSPNPQPVTVVCSYELF